MAANLLDLTTLASVKDWMGLKNSEHDDALARLITGISLFAQHWMGRTIKATSYTEQRDGHGGTGFILFEQPIVSIDSISIDGQNILVENYSTSKNGIYLKTGRFSRARNNVNITYTAGYAATPPDIEQAIIETVSLRWHERLRIGQQSKSIAGETVSFIISDFPPSALSILKLYRKIISV